jgi:hypothetical protein
VCNLISGNSGTAGIYLDGSGPAPGAASNTIQGNFIGTDVTGTVALGNSNGIRTFNPGANNLIGGTATGAGNLISGNGNGIFIGFSGSPNLTVQGNRIGTKLRRQCRHRQQLRHPGAEQCGRAGNHDRWNGHRRGERHLGQRTIGVLWRDRLTARSRATSSART